jgi:hypothetical protein
MPHKCARTQAVAAAAARFRGRVFFEGKYFWADLTVFLISTGSSTTASLFWHDACIVAWHGLLKAASLALLVATGL